MSGVRTDLELWRNADCASAPLSLSWMWGFAQSRRGTSRGVLVRSAATFAIGCGLSPISLTSVGTRVARYPTKGGEENAGFKFPDPVLSVDGDP